jgi:hypothetical protein
VASDAARSGQLHVVCAACDLPDRFRESRAGIADHVGKKGEYTASVRCLSEQQMIFFVVAGPDAGTVSGYMTTLFGQFGVL